MSTLRNRGSRKEEDSRDPPQTAVAQQQQQQQQQSSSSSSLLTKKALALSLSAPRAPPLASAHRQVLLGRDPSRADWIQSYSVKALATAADAVTTTSKKADKTTATDPLRQQAVAHSFYPHDTLRQRLRDRFLRSTHRGGKRRGTRRIHPHLPTGPELGDQITRTLGLWLPHAWTNRLRDSGCFRDICDAVVTGAVPLLGVAHPTAVNDFVRLTRQCQRLWYKDDDDDDDERGQQYVDVYLPEHTTATTTGRLVLFVHGGAWGSGLPWMYRLCALPFLEQGWAVAIPSYRVYPEGGAVEQVEDVQAALSFIRRRFPQHCGHVTLMGHSSGAHVGLLWLARSARHALVHGAGACDEPYPPVDAFVGLSGPYDVSHHFDYEAARGVEELSPMKPACGMTREGFRRCSPALHVLDTLALLQRHGSEAAVGAALPPRMLLLHSIEDETVPFTATAEAARVLRCCGVTQCQEIYLGPGTAHQDTSLELMTGGPTRNAVMAWMKEGDEVDFTANQVPATRLCQTSKL